jgi:putative DNA primase/helicase
MSRNLAQLYPESSRPGDNGTTIIWPEPSPLPNGLPPVKPFSYALLPEPLRPWVQDIAERMQAPAEFVAVTAIVAAGAVIGRKVGIRPQQHTDWHEVPNLWGCIIGRPGVMKSPSMKAAMAPLYRLENEAREDHTIRMDAFTAGEVEREMRADARKSAMKARLKDNPDADLSGLASAGEEEPKATRYIVNDGGYQALSEVLRNCAPNGVLAYRDELMSLVRALDDESRVEDRGFYLTGWNGSDSYTSDRIGRGFNLHIPAVTISLLGSTQPGKVRDYVARSLSGGAGDDGLIQRFGMMVWPDLDPNWKEVDRQPCPVARADAFAAFDRLARLAPDDVGAQSDEHHPERAYLRFDAEAQIEFKEWLRVLEHRLRRDELHPALESHLAKYRKLIPALALIHHLLSDRTGSVRLDSLEAACAWGEFLESHAERVYGAAIDDSINGAKTILRRAKSGDIGSTFTRQELQQKKWSGLTDVQAVVEATERLEAHNYLRIKKVETGGRPSYVCTLNPKVFSK